MTGQTAESSDTVNGKLRRSHRKSRNGCRNCKRRKVKCDEIKPECTNCVRFGMPCDFAGLDSFSTPTANSHAQLKFRDIPVRKRGRGRPRRDWSQDAEHSTPASLIIAPTPARKQDSVYDPYTLNTANIELMIHFTAITASTLSGVSVRYDRITSFWADNAPRIGLKHQYVLYLAFSMAAYHRAYLKEPSTSQLCGYIQQADHYFQTGITAFTAALADPNESNCGALDVSAQLVCLCTFAAGPKGFNDLLICRIDDDIAHNWRPLIKGLRLIREMFDPKVLFSGLMAPFAPSDDPPPLPDPRARCAQENFPRFDWETPLKELDDMVKSSSNQHRNVCYTELETLISIYRATFGDAKCEYDGPDHNRFVFGWLYRIKDSFAVCVRIKEPLALIILAYFAVLLKTMPKCWYIEGWSEHLLGSITEILPDPFRKWLQWPRVQVGLPP